MRGLRAVSEYSGLSLMDVLKLPCDMYMLCYKNWAIERLQATKEGREYLDDCERYRQTKMDRQGMAQLIEIMGG